MKVKKHLTLIVLGMVFLFLITGCPENTSGGPPTDPFIGGTEGLEIKFLEGSPPEEVTDGGTFPFQALVSLRNMGEYDLKKEDVEVSLIGVYAADFDTTESKLNDKKPEDDPSPKRRDSEGNIIEPVETFVTFPDYDEEFNYKDKLTGNTVFIFRADVCYEYQTKALAEICVLENLVDVADDAICEPGGSKEVFSSGSPIQVESFSQSVVGKDKIQFNFNIVRVGDGDIFEANGDVDCPKDPSERRRKENKVGVSVETGLEDGSLSCVGLESSSSDATASGSVRLVDGERTITCTQNLESGRNDFKRGINIVVDFNYLDKVDKEVLVKHLIS